jgi:hypothetical protein
MKKAKDYSLPSIETKEPKNLSKAEITTSLLCENRDTLRFVLKNTQSSGLSISEMMVVANLAKDIGHLGELLKEMVNEVLVYK